MRWTTLSILAWIGLFLLLVEVPLEIRAKGRGHETLLFGDHEPPPSKPAQPGECFGPTEAFPFRSRVHPMARTPGVPRVWVASASYALGSNVGPDQAFPVLLEDRLRAEGLPCEVLNAGRAALSIADNVRELEERGPIWRPDVVLLYQMSTDVDDVTRRVLAPGVAAEIDAEHEVPERWFEPRRWLERTTTYPILKGHLSARLTKARVLYDTLGDTGTKLFVERGLRPFVAQARALDATPLVSTFAVSHERDTPGDIPLHVFRFNIRLSSEGWHDTLDRWNERLVGYATSEGVATADVRSGVSGRPELFVDFVHFTAQGHERVAEALLPSVRAHVRRLLEGAPR